MAPRVGPSRVPRATTWADSVDSGEENRREQQQVPSASPAAHPSGACGGGGGLPSARGASPQTPAGAAAPAPQSPYKKRAEKFLRGWEYCFREQQGSSAIISTSSRRAAQTWFENHSDFRNPAPLLAIALAAWPYARKRTEGYDDYFFSRRSSSPAWFLDHLDQISAEVDLRSGEVKSEDKPILYTWLDIEDGKAALPSPEEDQSDEGEAGRSEASETA